MKSTKIRPAHQHADFSPVTPAQMRVVALVCTGHTDKEAGAMLGISESTASQHRSQAMRRMGCTTVVALTLKAICAGIVDPCKV